MMKTGTRFIVSKLAISLTVILLFLLSQNRADACAACMGAANSSVAPAMNAAIFLMLGVVFTLLLAVLGFVAHLVHRQRKMAVSENESSPDTRSPLAKLAKEKRVHA